jgi:hypothetical protein
MMLNSQTTPTSKTELMSAIRTANITKVSVIDDVTATNTKDIKKNMETFIKQSGTTKTVSVILVEARN